MELQVTKGQQSHIHEKSSQNEKWLYNNNKKIFILTSWFRKHIDNPLYTFLAMATTTATTATAPTTIATTPMRRRFYFLTCWKEGLKTILRILKKTVKDGKSFKVGRKFSKKILSLFLLLEIEVYVLDVILSPGSWYERRKLLTWCFLLLLLLLLHFTSFSREKLGKREIKEPRVSFISIFQEN